MVFQALPPPPQVKRWTADGYPTQAQVEYENREAEYKRSVESQISDLPANIDEIIQVQQDVAGVLSVQWSIVGNINGVTGGLTLTGIKKADGSGPTFNLEIDSNVTINGNLLVNGTISSPKIANDAVTTEKILANSVSYTGGASSLTGTSTVNLVGVPGAVVMIVGTYDGTAASGGGTITISVNGTVIASGTIPGISFTSMQLAAGVNPLYAAAVPGGGTNYAIISYAPNTTTSVYPRTIHTNYVVPPGVTSLSIKCSTNVGGPTSILAWELAR